MWVSWADGPAVLVVDGGVDYGVDGLVLRMEVCWARHDMCFFLRRYFCMWVLIVRNENGRRYCYIVSKAYIVYEALHVHIVKGVEECPGLGIGM